MWSAFENLFGRKPAIKEVNVHFNKKKLRVTFSPEDYDAEKQVPLHGFRAKLASALQVPPRELALYQVDPQRKLSNMKATLEDYGVRDGSDVLAVHVQPEAPKPAAAAKPPATVNERIDAIVGSVDTELGARISKLVNEGPPADPEQRETENRVLNEIVLAKTISLDDVEVTTPEERQHRKNAIARMQKYHKDIDAAMAQTPAQPAAPASAPASAPAAAAPAAAAPAAAAPALQEQAAQAQPPTPEAEAEAGAQPASSPAPSASNSAKARKKKAQNKKKGKR